MSELMGMGMFSVRDTAMFLVTYMVIHGVMCGQRAAEKHALEMISVGRCRLR